MVIIDTKRNKWFVQYSVTNWVPSLHVNPALGMALVEPVGGNKRKKKGCGGGLNKNQSQRIAEEVMQHLSRRDPSILSYEGSSSNHSMLFHNNTIQ